MKKAGLLLLIVLIVQLGIGVGQILDSSAAASLPCTFHVDHCDYTGCTGLCQILYAEDPEAESMEDQSPPPPAPAANRCWCVFVK